MKLENEARAGISKRRRAVDPRILEAILPKPTVESTIEFIKSAHAGQVDKAGVAYWHHPVSVMKRLGTDALDDYKLAALLHDVIEDTKYGASDLRAMGYRLNANRDAICRRFTDG